ncbi:unnamed protein product [Miscanthus lutarioriparius]|uniref:Uncharacterized protein n=1 Tax=Miscanthus lutarioriparius TaxID=422564 RepID=A0A811PBX9_9POAL|nr:unnamed protein product [Miscanthus lutarioriparius]
MSPPVAAAAAASAIISSTVRPTSGTHNSVISASGVCYSSLSNGSPSQLTRLRMRDADVVNRQWPRPGTVCWRGKGKWRTRVVGKAVKTGNGSEAG